ncbi:hypothetical protein PRNP1_010418 [Phytophthora ramorum]
MIEYYSDTNCDKLEKSKVYRADGQCHFFTYGVMKMWVAEDASMAAVLSSRYCESDDWYVVMDMNVSVNTGACIPHKCGELPVPTQAVKYVLIDDPASGSFSSKVSVYTGYDNPLCEEPSTARIEVGGCNETDQFECVDYNGVGGWGNVTYYGRGKCSNSRQGYLTSAFAGSPVFMVETYEDPNCQNLKMTEVYKADGRCHYFTLGVMKVWVSEDNSKAALLTASSCGSNDWSVSGSLSVTVNTGACIRSSTGAEKFILITDPAGTSPASMAGSYGRNLWPDRDESLCTHQSEDVRSACRVNTLVDVEQRGILRLLDLGSELLRHDKWSPMPKLHPALVEGGITLPELLLQYLLPINRRLFGLWKTACIETHGPARLQELEECRCIHEQLIHGISTARGIQHLTDQYDLDLEWCALLSQREEVLFQRTGSVLSTLCGADDSKKHDQERRAYLDTILC